MADTHDDKAPSGPPDQAKGKPENDAGGEERRRPSRRWPLIAVIAGVAVAVIAGGAYWFSTRNQVNTDDAFTDGRAVMMAARVSGYVQGLAVNDNQFVHAGDLLVQIDPRDYQAARDQAQGQVEAIRAQLENAKVAFDKAKVIYPAQLAQAQGRLAQARAQHFQAETEYRRQHLVVPAATSRQSIDSSTANFQGAEGQVQQAEAEVAEASPVDQNIAQAETQVHQLEGQLKQAEANLRRAEINLGYTRITAPQDGWITRRNVEKGNYLQPGTQVFAIVVPQFWVTANFKETQLARMRPGQKVAIHVDAFPDLKLAGHVDSIQRGSGARFSAFPAENATGNYVKVVQRVPVKILIDSGLDPNRPLGLGLSVEPTVTVE